MANTVTHANSELPAVTDNGPLLLGAGVSLLHSGDLTSGRRLIADALTTGVDRRAVARLLLGAAHVSLGRAAMLGDRSDLGVRQLAEAVRMGGAGTSSLFLDLLMNEADRCSRLQDDREALQRWQDIVSLLGEHATDYVYRRLSLAYSKNIQAVGRTKFGGTKEENHWWGDCHKHEILGVLHERLMPELYLEIGVDAGLSLARSRGRSVGVDPRSDLALEVPLPESASIVSMSSDAFFRDHAARWLNPRPELVLIDGMHLFEFGLRDFMNVERYAAPTTLVVIDDIYPCHPTQALRRRRSGVWTGDIWKLHQILREMRPDLTLIALNAHPTGVLLVAGLDPDNHELSHVYDRSVSRYRDIDKVPEEVLARHGAIPSDHVLVGQLVEVLLKSKKNGLSIDQVRERLLEFKIEIADAEAEFIGRAISLSGVMPCEPAPPISRS